MAQYFSSKDPSETISYSFGYKALFGAGETITSTSAALVFYSGPSPSDTSAQLVGSVVTNGNFVSQLVTGGVSGNTYELSVTIVTNKGQTILLCGLLPVESC